MFADRGSNEGSTDYERHRSAQIRFEDQGFEEVEDPVPFSKERYKVKIAESQYRAAWKRPHGAHTSGPPAQHISKDEDSSDNEEYDDQHHETTKLGNPQFNYYGPQKPAQPQYNYRTNYGTKGPEFTSA